MRRHVNQGRPVYYRGHFDPNSASITPDCGAIKDVLEVLAADNELKVELDGHCDDPCTFEESMALARRRIAAIADYFETNGIARERMIKIAGANNLHRVVSGETEQGRAYNRRVDVRPVY